VDGFNGFMNSLGDINLLNVFVFLFNAINDRCRKFFN